MKKTFPSQFNSDENLRKQIFGNNLQKSRKGHFRRNTAENFAPAAVAQTDLDDAFIRNQPQHAYPPVQYLQTPTQLERHHHTRRSKDD